MQLARLATQAVASRARRLRLDPSPEAVLVLAGRVTEGLALCRCPAWDSGPVGRTHLDAGSLSSGSLASFSVNQKVDPWPGALSTPTWP